MKNMRKGLIASTMVILILSGVIFASKGADGTTGTIESPVEKVYEDLLFTIELTGLTASSDYKVNWTANNDGVDLTTGSGQTERKVDIKVNGLSATDTEFVIYLRYQSAGTLIDSISLRVGDIDNEAQVDLLTSIVSSILPIMFFFGIMIAFFTAIAAIGLKAGKRKR